MRKLAKNIVNAITRVIKPRWPTPRYDENNQPHLFFLITPPYSGSTAIAKLLDTSSRTMTLVPNGEGQLLLPGLCEEDRWEPKKEVNYDSVKATWLAEFQKRNRLEPQIDVVIEKSPPNMVRIDELLALFADYSLLANNRDPYAYCASSFYRNHEANKISAEKRKEVLEQLANNWLIRSGQIKAIISKYEIPLLTYERFCEQPAAILELLKLPEGVIDSIDFGAKVKVKDYTAQPIVNHNARQISSLTEADLASISQILAADLPLLELFGYQLRP